MFLWCRKYLCGAITKHCSLYSGCRQQHYFQFQYEVFATRARIFFFYQSPNVRSEVRLEPILPIANLTLKNVLPRKASLKERVALEVFQDGQQKKMTTIDLLRKNRSSATRCKDQSKKLGSRFVISRESVFACPCHHGFQNPRCPPT